MSNHEHKRFGFSQSSRKMEFLWRKPRPQKTFFLQSSKKVSLLCQSREHKRFVFPQSSRKLKFLWPKLWPKKLFFCNHQEKSVFFVKGVNTKGLVFPNHQVRALCLLLITQLRGCVCFLFCAPCSFPAPAIPERSHQNLDGCLTTFDRF